MHVYEVEGILALFLICLRQIATSKKLLNRLSGFLDNIHDVLLFTMHKSCARIVCPGRPKCLAQFSLEYMATRLSGYAKRVSRGCPLSGAKRTSLSPNKASARRNEPFRLYAFGLGV